MLIYSKPDTAPAFDGQRWAGDENAMNRFCINRHEQAINGAFLDYTVRKAWLKELWRIRWSRRFNVNAGPTEWPDWMKNFKNN